MDKFKLALKTKDFNYYIDETESDENSSVIMKDKEGKVVSENYFAYGSFFDDLEKAIKDETSYEFIDEEVLKNGIEHFKNN